MKTNYQTKKLGEVCEIARGGSPRPITSYITDLEDGINWIKISDATSSEKYIYKTKEKIKKEGLHKTRMVYPGDFILTNSMSFGRPYIMKTEGAIHDGWLLLRPNKELLDEEYLYHFLSSDEVYKQFKNLASGAVVKNLNSELVRGLEIILPRLSIQKKIVAILDEKMNAIAEAKKLREEAIADTDKILSQTLREIFKEGREKGWEEKAVGEVANLMTGATPSTTRPDYYGGDIKWLVSGDIHNREIFDCEGRINELGIKNSNAKILPKNSLLIALNGQGKTKGTVAILRAEATCNQSLVAMIPDVSFLKVEYLYYCLHYQYRKIRSMAGDDSRKGLNMKIVREIKFLLPSLPEQKEIVTRLDKLSAEIRELRELQQSQLEDLKKLEKAYLREAFRGELA